jgi:hypothetical protein
MNHKDERIRKLHNRGVTDPQIIAQKIGYSGKSLEAGIQRVIEAFERLGIPKTNH